MSNITEAQRLPKAVVAEKAPKPESDLRRSMRLFNRFLQGLRGVFGLALLMLILESVTSIGAKFPVGWLLDYLGDGQQPAILTTLGLGALVTDQVTLLVFITIAILLTAIGNSLTDSLSEMYLVKGGRLLGFRVRDLLYSHLQKLSLAFFSQQRVGDLLTRVTGDVTALEDFAVKSLKDIAGSVFLIVLTLVTLFITSWQMGLIAILTVPLLSLASNYFADRIKSAAKKQRAREGELAASAQEMLTSIRVIQTYGSAGNQQERFAEQSRKTMDIAVQVGRLQAWFGGVISLLQAVVVVIIVWVAVALVNGNVITFGQTYIFITLIQDLFKPTKRIIKQWNEVGKIIASAERIGEVLDRKPDVEDMAGAVVAPPLNGHVAFKNVSFAYQVVSDDDGPPQLRLALRDVNFTISPGEVVALVGGSGAGKSTIVQLLPRLYDPSDGQILIDGRDIREFTLDSLRSRMSMVLQEAILFVGTVAENIAYGRPDATREEVIAAAMQASAHDFIEKLPKGYDTILSERASNLSGGQRQRIAIARAFIRNTPILILDEPTTGLDAESTELVQLALRSLMKGKATVIISHDLNLIRQADKIVVVKLGQVEQVGSHKALLKAGGVYADLYYKQFGAVVQEQGGDMHSAPPPVAVPADEDDEDVAPVSPKLFQTMMTKALPKPVSSQAFQTMMMQALPPGGPPVPGAAPASNAAPVIARPDAPTVPVQPITATPKPATPAPPAKPAERAIPPQPAPAGTTPPAQPRPAPATNSATPAPTPAPPTKSDAPAHPAIFETTVMRIIPDRPAAEQAAPVSLLPERLVGVPLDPLGSPILRQELPGIELAFNEQKMQEYLQAVLFGKSNPNYTIERCEVDQAAYPSSDGCLLRYQLSIYDKARGRNMTPLLSARIFPNQIACAVYMRDRLAPVAALMRGREEVAPYMFPVTMLEPLNMVVHVFPIDGDLPTLAGATDSRRMAEVLGEALSDGQDEGLKVERFQAELVDYARWQRCTLRYHVEGRRPDTGQAEQRTVYGKVFADNTGALAGPVTEALRAYAHNRQGYQFNIPRLLAWRPDLKLALLEEIPGTPVIADALRARLRGEPAPAGTPPLETMIDACAQIAAALHTSNIKLGKRRTFDDEMAALHGELAPIVRVSPELGAQLQEWMAHLQAYAEQSDPLRLRFSHGDFTHGQVIFDGAASGLVDFDGVCQAEPALDLAQFLAYLRFFGRKATPTMPPARGTTFDQLGERFLSAYIAAAGDQIEDVERLRVRISAYQVVSSLRRAMRSWQKVKAGRLENAVAILKEEIACLPLLDY